MPSAIVAVLHRQIGFGQLPGQPVAFRGAGGKLLAELARSTTCSSASLPRSSDRASASSDNSRFALSSSWLRPDRAITQERLRQHEHQQHEDDDHQQRGQRVHVAGPCVEAVAAVPADAAAGHLPRRFGERRDGARQQPQIVAKFRGRAGAALFGFAQQPLQISFRCCADGLG